MIKSIAILSIDNYLQICNEQYVIQNFIVYFEKAENDASDLEWIADYDTEEV